jgi:hypothetical protein
MTELTHDKTYRFLMLLFMAVIALSSVLVVLELNSPKVIQVKCDDMTTPANKYTGQPVSPAQVVYRYYSDGSFDARLENSYACFTPLEKRDGKNYPRESTTTTVPQP